MHESVCFTFLFLPVSALCHAPSSHILLCTLSSASLCAVGLPIKLTLRPRRAAPLRRQPSVKQQGGGTKQVNEQRPITEQQASPQNRQFLQELFKLAS